MEEGRELIKREKRRRERLEEQERGRRDWREGRVGGGEARQRTGLQEEVVTWEPPPPAGAGTREGRNKEPPRNIFDDL